MFFFKEYTFLTILALTLTLILDLFGLKTKLFLQKKFWLFLLLLILLQTIVDNYLNGRWGMGGEIVGPYGERFYSGIKIWHTPLENYGFGIALIGLNLIIYQFLNKRSSEKT